MKTKWRAAVIAAVLILAPAYALADSQRADGPIRRWLRARREHRQERAPEATPANTVIGTLSADGRLRTYRVHLPAAPRAPAAGPRYPLVLVFHGGHGSGEKIAEQTTFSDWADREGFIVAYPDGIERGWNDGRGTSRPEQLGVDDVRFVRLLIEELQRRYPIDARRIYAAGVSNGGMLAHRLGCELADVLAAIGPVVGPIASNMAPRCAPARPVSVVAIQGTADPLIPFEGGEEGGELRLGRGGQVESAQATLELWASKNGCPASPDTRELPPQVDDGTRVTKITYAPCRAGTAVTLYIVHGMGHGWPPRQGRSVTGPGSKNIDATDVLWEFFKAHPLS